MTQTTVAGRDYDWYDRLSKMREAALGALNPSQRAEIVQARTVQEAEDHYKAAMKGSRLNPVLAQLHDQNDINETRHRAIHKIFNYAQWPDTQVPQTQKPFVVPPLIAKGGKLYEYVGTHLDGLNLNTCRRWPYRSVSGLSANAFEGTKIEDLLRRLSEEGYEVVDDGH